MKILSANHKHLDFSWVKLSASARSTLTLIAAVVALSSVSTLFALLLFTKAAAASEPGAANTALAAEESL
ncbi:hypothetical protein [Paucibacter sp. DJ2R-2]|uniref:hypothetical protein n=1 Tax=Paucibacter sp. DJ2R-2 TaxID=2893558 RepID=UPI0021E3E234|nr:hypothetical protein [Paucibacter sp. DJ2R-2]MCV2419582.1 hypothetical protein [Paucibacter sp. DJ4R-1]MCV2437515.1 hypothetical protein [Paucibacter sp. DJ2R-2]